MTMTFSRRTAWDLAENDLTAAVRAHLRKPRPGQRHNTNRLKY